MKRQERSAQGTVRAILGTWPGLAVSEPECVSTWSVREGAVCRRRQVNGPVSVKFMVRNYTVADTWVSLLCFFKYLQTPYHELYLWWRATTLDTKLLGNQGTLTESGGLELETWP